MTQKKRLNNALTATKAPLLTGIISVVLVLGFLGAVLYPVLIITLMPQLETIVTLQDFKSQSDCIGYLDAHLPVPLPEGAVVSDFELVSWLGWTLEATVRLPDGSAVGYVNSVHNLNSKSTDSESIRPSTESTARYKLQGNATISGTVSCDAGSGLLSIYCVDFS